MANLVAKYNFNYRIMSLYGLCLLLLFFLVWIWNRAEERVKAKIKVRQVFNDTISAIRRKDKQGGEDKEL